MARKWTPDHERRRNRILALLSRDSAPVLSSTEIEAIKALPFALKIRRLFPQFIKSPDAPFHPRIDAKLHAAGRMEFVIGARNSAKSSRIMVCGTATDVCERVFPYTAFGAGTLDAAAEKADIVRLLLEHSAILRAVYGDKIGCELGHDEETDWVANGCRVRSLGLGQSIRGALSASGDRINCFRGDDLDNLLLNRSRDRQDNLWDWLRGEVYQALADPGGKSVFTVLCNMFNRTCMGARAIELAEQHPELCGVEILPLLGPDNESTWPGRFSTEQVLKMMALAGPSRARTEYLCLPANDEAKFQPEWCKDYSLARLAPSVVAGMRKVLWLDPSFSAKETSDYKAVVVLGRTPRQPEVYCLHAWIRKATAEAAAKEVALAWLRFGANLPCLIEGNSGARDTYVAVFRNLVREGMQVPSPAYPITTVNKEQDIGQWEGEFSNGLCHFDRTEGDQQLLVTQICDWPKGHDDGFDAWAKARGVLGPADGSGSEIRVGSPRTDYSALAGIRRRTPPLPGSFEEKWQADDNDQPLSRMNQFVGI